MDKIMSDLRVGKIISCVLSPKAKKPAYIIGIDFGESIGVLTSSAQLTQSYLPEKLIGRLIIADIGLGVKMIAGVKSQCLVLAAVYDAKMNYLSLIQPDQNLPLGTKVF